MQPPKDSVITETPTSTFWYDENGILCSISKKAPPLSMEETIKVTEEFKKALHGKKICMLADVTNTTESTKAIRDYAAKELPKFVKAVAMVSNSVLGAMLANLFFKMKNQPYPVKMFKKEEEARQWLKQYL